MSFDGSKNNETAKQTNMQLDIACVNIETNYDTVEPLQKGDMLLEGM